MDGERKRGMDILIEKNKNGLKFKCMQQTLYYIIIYSIIRVYYLCLKCILCRIRKIKETAIYYEYLACII